jgi:nitric oxide reductase subunit C
MKTFRYKITIFLFLLIAFLSYSATLYYSDTTQAEIPSPLAQKGRLLWQDKNCTSCHQFYGLGGHLGPDLTNVYAKRSPEYITAFLKTGTLVMPNYDLSDAEIQAFLAFFKYTNTTGIADPTSFSKNFDGTVSQPKN